MLITIGSWAALNLVLRIRLLFCCCLVILSALFGLYGPWGAAVGLAALLASWGFLVYAMNSLPPRFLDQGTQLALYRVLKRKFLTDGLPEEEASEMAADRTVLAMGPNAMHDPEAIRWMVDRHGNDQLNSLPADVRDAYLKYWALPREAPRYAIIQRDVTDETSRWEAVEMCADLQAADRRRAELNRSLIRQGLLPAYAIAAITLLPEYVTA